MSDISPVNYSFLPAFLKVGGSADGPPSSWKTTLFGVGIVAGIFFAVKWFTKPPPSLPKVTPDPEGSSNEKAKIVVKKETHDRERSPSPPPLTLVVVEQVDTSDNEESGSPCPLKKNEYGETESGDISPKGSPRLPRSSGELKEEHEDNESGDITPKGSPKSPRSPRSPFSPGGVSYDSINIGWETMQSHHSPAGKSSKKNLLANSGDDNYG